MKARYLTLCCLAAACVGPAGSPEPVTGAEISQAAAAEALRQDPELVRHMVERAGGNPDVPLTPGEPFDIYMVYAAELAASQEALAPLLHSTERRLFPLLDPSGAVVTSLTLARTGTGWKLVRVGEKSVAVALEEARARLGAREARLVRLPGVGIELMAAQGTLTPLFDHEELGVRARVARPEREMLVQLAPGAQRVLERE